MSVKTCALAPLSACASVDGEGQSIHGGRCASQELNSNNSDSHWRKGKSSKLMLLNGFDGDGVLMEDIMGV